jgi:hypothetical protein
MKHFLLRQFILLSACVSTAAAQNGAMFRYKISSSAGATGSVTGWYSDGSSRTEIAMMMPNMPQGGFNKTTIQQKDKPGILISVDDKAKTYSERVMQERTNTDTTRNATVKIIGNEKMGGYNCIHSQVTENNRVSEFWTTKDIPDYEKYASAHKGGRYMGRGNAEAALKKAGADGFLVKTFSKDAGGVETSVELEKFEKQDVSADKFTIPAGYTKTEAPAGMPAGQGIDYSKLKDMTPEERQKFIEKMKKENGGGN